MRAMAAGSEPRQRSVDRPLVEVPSSYHSRWRIINYQKSTHKPVGRTANPLLCSHANILHMVLPAPSLTVVVTELS